MPRWLVEAQTSVVYGLLSAALFTPLIVQLRLVPVLALTVAHAFTIDSLYMTIAYNSRVAGLLFAMVVFVVSAAVAGLVDWRCRLRFMRRGLAARKAGKPLP
jgi:hypothetical protein